MLSTKTEPIFCCRDILKVTKVSQLKFVATEDLVQIGLSKPEQRRYKKIYTKYFPNPYISKIKKLLSSKRSETVSSTFKKCEIFKTFRIMLPLHFDHHLSGAGHHPVLITLTVVSHSVLSSESDIGIFYELA